MFFNVVFSPPPRINMKELLTIYIEKKIYLLLTPSIELRSLININFKKRKRHFFLKN